MITIKTTAISILFFVSLLFTGCDNETKTSARNTSNSEVKPDTLFVIKNVNIIPMTVDNTVIENATVIIDDKKIVGINTTIPDGATIIDGKEKWLIPGLVDMHVHTHADINFKENKPTQGATVFFNTQDVMGLYVANGITTTFNLDARVEHFAQRNEIASGKVMGPRMALAALIDGGEGWGRKANTASDGRQAVRSAKAEGYNFIKVYSFLNADTFKAIVDEANKQGLKVVGHIPDVFRGNLEEVFVPHFDLVAHAEEYSKHSKNKTVEDAQYFAKLAKENNTWLISSLTTMIWIRSQLKSLDEVQNSEYIKYLHPILQDRWLNPSTNHYYKRTSPEFIATIDAYIDFHKKLIKAFNDAGVPIVAGTDSGIPVIIPGFSLHDELGLMVEASMTNEKVLLSATRLPAEWLGIDKETGTVEVGKYADLILLDKNPLEDIKNTRTVNGVFVSGTWVDKKRLDTMLSGLAQYNEKNKENFKWEKRREY
ncbi:amidohydrolase family protein [Aquimarina sp. 2-A2]|uniref:amidohydrolase family protein n=1 Tax=Aquimarina sp. 2-A2 TaxID=3382644 RepID=UPI00387F2A28